MGALATPPKRFKCLLVSRSKGDIGGHCFHEKDRQVGFKPLRPIEKLFLR